VPDGRGWLWSPSLQLWIGRWEGTYKRAPAIWLRLYDQEGRLALTSDEAAEQRAEAAQVRAEAEQARAEAEQARAEAEQARAEAEQATLRRSGHTLRRSGHTLRPNAQEPTPPKPKSLVYMLNWPGCEG